MKNVANASAVPSKPLDCTQNRNRSRARVSQTQMRAQVDNLEDPLTAVRQLLKEGLNDGDLLRLMLMTISTQLYRLPGQINRAFAAKPFISGVPPDDPINQRRFTAHVSYLARVITLLERSAQTASIVHKMLEERDTSRKRS